MGYIVKHSIVGLDETLSDLVKLRIQGHFYDLKSHVDYYELNQILYKAFNFLSGQIVVYWRVANGRRAHFVVLQCKKVNGSVNKTRGVQVIGLSLSHWTPLTRWTTSQELTKVRLSIYLLIKQPKISSIYDTGEACGIFRGYSITHPQLQPPSCP